MTQEQDAIDRSVRCGFVGLISKLANMNRSKIHGRRGERHNHTAGAR